MGSGSSSEAGPIQAATARAGKFNPTAPATGTGALSARPGIVALTAGANGGSNAPLSTFQLRKQNAAAAQQLEQQQAEARRQQQQQRVQQEHASASPPATDAIADTSNSAKGPRALGVGGGNDAAKGGQAQAQRVRRLVGGITDDLGDTPLVDSDEDGDCAALATTARGTVLRRPAPPPGIGRGKSNPRDGALHSGGVATGVINTQPSFRMDSNGGHSLESTLNGTGTVGSLQREKSVPQLLHGLQQQGADVKATGAFTEATRRANRLATEQEIERRRQAAAAADRSAREASAAANRQPDAPVVNGTTRIKLLLESFKQFRSTMRRHRGEGITDTEVEIMQQEQAAYALLKEKMALEIRGLGQRVDVIGRLNRDLVADMVATIMSEGDTRRGSVELVATIFTTLSPIRWCFYAREREWLQLAAKSGFVAFVDCLLKHVPGIGENPTEDDVALVTTGLRPQVPKPPFNPIDVLRTCMRHHERRLPLCLALLSYPVAMRFNAAAREDLDPLFQKLFVVAASTKRAAVGEDRSARGAIISRMTHLPGIVDIDFDAEDAEDGESVISRAILEGDHQLLASALGVDFFKRNGKVKWNRVFTHEGEPHTYLSLAATKGTRHLVEFLIQIPDVDFMFVVSPQCGTAFDIAREKKAPLSILELLDAHFKKLQQRPNGANNNAPLTAAEEAAIAAREKKAAEETAWRKQQLREKLRGERKPHPPAFLSAEQIATVSTRFAASGSVSVTVPFTSDGEFESWILDQNSSSKPVQATREMTKLVDAMSGLWDGSELDGSLSLSHVLHGSPNDTPNRFSTNLAVVSSFTPASPAAGGGPGSPTGKHLSAAAIDRRHGLARRVMDLGHRLAVDRDVREAIIDVVQMLMSEGHPASLRLARVLLFRVVSIDFAPLVSEYRWPHNAAVRGDEVALETALRVPKLWREENDVVQLLQMCTRHTTKRIALVMVMLRHAEALRLATYREHLRPVWDELLETLVNPGKIEKDEHRLQREELLCRLCNATTFVSFRFDAEVYNGLTYFMRACRDGDSGFVRTLVDLCLVDVNRVSVATKTTALLQAVTFNHMDIVQALCELPEIWADYVGPNGSALDVAIALKRNPAVIAVLQRAVEAQRKREIVTGST